MLEARFGKDGSFIADIWGNKEWRFNGKLHRENGPAFVGYNGESECWLINGLYHRENAPAIKDRDSKYWYLNEKLHREDGPAIEYNDGYKEWWLDEIKYTEEEYNKELIKRGLK